MDSLNMYLLFGVIILIASLFSNKQGSTTLIFNILIFLAIIAGLYNNPNIESLLFILLAVSVYFLYTRRYWRNREGFRINN
jgi:4-amino-4-deoxy-L-arabinose transferase-like glycosyltransferase